MLTAAFLAALCATLCVTVPALAAPDKNDAASAKKTQDVASGGEEAKAPAKKKATKKKATKKKATKKKATKKKAAKKKAAKKKATKKKAAKKKAAKKKARRKSPRKAKKKRRKSSKRRKTAKRPKPKPRKPGSKPGEPVASVRRVLTGEYPNHSDQAPTESAELKAMRELDRLLFPPTSAPAATPWNLVLPRDSRNGQPTVSGLPLAATSSSRADSVTTPAANTGDAAQADLSWLTKLKKPDFPVRLEPSVVRYLLHYKNNKRGNALARRWIQKSGRYRADIERLLQSHNLPQDLLWLALIESAFNPEIHSHAGAAGLWQFMPATARIYGLTVNRSIDERLDPERSTIAALRHLSDLHKRFGTWELAFAAYNMGYGGLLSSLRKFNTNDYWELRRLEAGLPYETALYVPKIMAIAIIANNCDVFGCAGVQLDKARPFDKVAVGPGVTLKDIAEASGAKLEQIAGLNPQLIGSRTPPLQQAVAAPWRSEGHVVQARRSWTVYVPRGKGALTQEKLTPSAVPKRYGLHEVRWGESLARVAESYNTSSGYLTQINDLPASAAVRPGKVLFVPRREKSRADAPDEKTVAVVPAQTFSRSAQRRVFYDAVFGDRVQDVARVCGVEVDELVRWNHLDPAAKLQSGMRLQLFLPPTARPKNVRLVDADAYDVMSVESTPFFEHFVGLLDRKRLEITVAEGDTWRDYSKRFGLSLGMLERINHKSRRSKLEPGSKVVVYAKRALVPDSHATSASTSTARSVQNR